MSRLIQVRSGGPGPGSTWASGRGGDQGSTGEVSLSDLIRVLRRRRRLILASLVVVLLLGALYCVVKTRRYESVADLAINPEGSDALDMGDITASLGGGGLGFDEKLETQVHVLRSDSLAWTVISELRLDRQPTFAGHRKLHSLWAVRRAGRPREDRAKRRRSGGTSYWNISVMH